jgi:hypothetical protein
MQKKQPNTLFGKPGRLPAKKDPRVLTFSKYIDIAKLKNVPKKLNWATKVKRSWGMMSNWTLSDCTCAAAGHMIECWTANSKKEYVIQDKAVLKAFIALSGYDPATGKNDNPIYMSDALKYWRKNGIGKHKIKAYATINHKDYAVMRAAIYLFGGVYVGLSLPETIKGQHIWEVSAGALTGKKKRGSFGGHTVNVVGYDDQYVTCISWGKKQKMTWKFWDTYCDELYAIITEDFLRDNKNPIGLNLASLEADLLSTTREKITVKKELNSIKKNINATKIQKKVAGTHGLNMGKTATELKKKSTKKIVSNKPKPAAKKKISAGNSGRGVR